MNHVLESQQFTVTMLLLLFKKADEFRKLVEKKRFKKLSRTLDGLQLISLFYEASTRTRMSFEMAARYLGMQITTTESAGIFSSAAKGETLWDTIRVLSSYHPSAIVLRHNETGACEIAARAAQNNVAIINAGDGKGQHPTQAALDVYTIFREFGRLENLTILLGGDLLNGRTGRSLCYLLSKFKGVQFIFLAPPSLQMKPDIRQHLDKRRVPWKLATNMRDVLPEADVIYWTRVQHERLSQADKRRFNGKSPYRITRQMLQYVKSSAIIMHPLPRVDEINIDVDKDPRARYFEQASNGLFIRMAILWYVLGRKELKRK